MDFTGRYVIPVPPEVVWAAINDPDILKACIPGCQEMTKTDPAHFEAAVTLKIGPVKAAFRGKVALEELDPPKRCVLKGEGQGGAAGFARGEAEVVLMPENGATVLNYTAKATVGGKLAQIGQRLIDGAARQIADAFFEKFAAAVSGGMEAMPLPVPEAFQPEATAAPATSDEREGVAPEIWIVGLIGVIVILLVLFGVAL